jgi:exodeoxyribonuclease VII small subunit
MSKQTANYKTMMQELQSLLMDMQSDDLDVDIVIAKYQRGQMLLAELKKYLENAENKIIKRTLPKSTEAE